MRHLLLGNPVTSALGEALLAIKFYQVRSDSFAARERDY